MTANFEQYLAYSAEVRAARDEGRPLVALESTIVTHGMPWPQNVETARSVEADIRSAGAVPATVAVIDGMIRVGLEDETLVELAQAEGVMKLSRADLALVVAAGRTGSTTVAATMICAHLAGIEVFATGGIGGVHRGAELSFDVSADLEELAATPVLVVAAGAKAILDIAKTLEYLETKGVPVVGYRTDDFPAFWSCSSGLAAPLRLDDPAEIAEAFHVRRELGMAGGMLVANPIPASDEIPATVISPIIEQALTQTDGEGVAGKDVTPYVLGRIFELTDGRSLSANVALVRNNARLAAEIAIRSKKS